MDGSFLHCCFRGHRHCLERLAAKKTGKVLFLIQNSIHAGEMDGTDACLALVRDIVVTKERASLLDSVILLVIPMFNVDGHENRIRYTRPNQGGPENAGTVFKVTADGALTPLHFFTGTVDGGTPYGGLVLGRDGCL